MTFFLVAVLLLLLSAPLSLFAYRGSGFWEKSSLASLLAGCAFGMAAVVQAFMTPGGLSLSLPWAVPGGAFSLAIDGLAAVFLLPAFLLTAAGSIYAVGYWPQKKDPASGSLVRFFYSLLATGIVLVLTAANAVLFLFAWEIMALAGYFLVTTERSSDEAQKAGFLYLACTHVGTLALFALFAMLGTFSETGSLPAPASLDASVATGTAIFFIALFGFGFKAGLMPLHIWLPKAHAAAPSHVSALMSGVMIKTGIYGIMRVTTLFYNIPAWWGWTILGLGVVSAVLGIVLAIAQHDLKRMLAYCSVENIGIILIGFGTALLGLSYQEPALFILGLAGALLHVVNHGLFKGLLFLGAGSVIHATGTRELARYGGLLRSMPITALFFLGGSVAICGLPPLNGFVSEWFVYLGLLQAGSNSSTNLAMLMLAMPALAMAGGLALLCFTKVFGLSFLGEPRTSNPGKLHEAPPSMLGGMGMLFAACLWIGLLPATLVPLLTNGISVWPAVPADPHIALAALAPAGTISMSALGLLVLLGIVGSVSFLLNRHRPAASCTTWGCGYLFGTSRMQYSGPSFAQMVGGLFQWARRTSSQEEKTKGLFPRRASLATHTPDAVLDLLVMPGCLKAGNFADKIHRIVHHGMLNIYMLYIAVALGLLLWLAVS